MSSTRMKGSALSLTFDGIDYWADVTGARITSVENGEPFRGWSGNILDFNRKFFIIGTAIQSLESSSFWRFVWANSGKIVDFRYAALGNHEPSEDMPHLVGQVQVGPHPTVGGDAGPGEYGFEFEWAVINKPDIDYGGTPQS